MSDFVTDFMTYSEGALSPDIYRKWSAISLVAGACERRLWVKTGRLIGFVNLYVLLVGPPGVGKRIISDVKNLWREAKDPTGGKPFAVNPDNMTKASLLDTIAKAKRSRLPPRGAPLNYHSLLVAAEEFSVLLPSFDLEFIGVITSLWNNEEFYEESRRTGTVRELKIEKPCLNIIGGAQPSYLTSVFPEDAWNTGLSRRMIMIYSGENHARDLFFEGESQDELRKQLLARLGQMSQLYGQLDWVEDAKEHFRAWHMAGGPPTPVHSKLTHYLSGRSQNVTKLAAVSCVSRGNPTEIQLVDIKRAIDWLCEAEALMPDVFRAMIGKSDSSVMEELRLFMTNWEAKQRTAVPGAAIWRFMKDRVPSEKIWQILQIMERSNIMQRVAGTEDDWVVNPRFLRSVE